MSDLGLSSHHVAKALRQRLGVTHFPVAVLCPDAVATALGALTDPVRTPMAAVGLPVADGRANRAEALSWACAGTPVLVLGGRAPDRDALGPGSSVLAIRAAASCGATTIVLVHSVRSLRPQWPPGTPVMVTDHLDLVGATETSPLVGAPEWTADVDASAAEPPEVYSMQLRAALSARRPDLAEGVHAVRPGPGQETPAEARAFATLGADVVSVGTGTSLSREALWASRSGLRVVGLDLVTGYAAGLSGPAGHDPDYWPTGMAEVVTSAVAEALGTGTPAALGAPAPLPALDPPM